MCVGIFSFLLNWNGTKAVSREEILKCSSRSCPLTSCWEQEDSALTDRVPGVIPMPLDEGSFPVVLYTIKETLAAAVAGVATSQLAAVVGTMDSLSGEVTMALIVQNSVNIRFSSSFLISNNKLLS